MIMRKETKYWVNLCLHRRGCALRTQDKKTKLPLCTYKEQCNQQFKVSQTYLANTKLKIDDFRKIRFKLVKNT